MAFQNPFRVALTADFYAAGSLRYRDIGLSLLEGNPQFTVGRLAENLPDLTQEQLAGWNGVIVLAPRVTAASLIEARDLLVISRFGVGYDTVDVAACTRAGVLVTITVGAVDHSVAEATVGWMLAITHHFRAKDRLVRNATWEARSHYMGSELRGRTLGIVGCGGIGRAVLKMLAGFGMNPPLVYDPYLPNEAVTAMGAEPVLLDQLLARSDFVSLHCPLNDLTRGMIGPSQLALMKPTAYLINTARGGIVDEAALYDVLASGRLAGAAIDCFDAEPLTTPPRLASLDNVLLAPHCIAWTDELFRDIGRAACQTMLDLAAGRPPRGMVNPEVLDRPNFQAKWKRVRS